MAPRVLSDEAGLLRELLSELEQANLFLIPLDDDRVWYRYHHLFADFLRTELSKTDTETLYKKAALWHEQNDLLTEAVQYAISSVDLDFWQMSLIGD